MKELPLISFVTVNYNGLNDTKALLSSIISHLEEISYEIIVVDNGSKIDEAKILSAEYPNIVSIRSDCNLGFAGGNNLGIKRSKGAYIMLLNNDTLLLDSSIIKLTEILKRELSIAAVSPKIVFQKPEDTIQFAGFTELSKITIRNKAIGYGEYDAGQYNLIKETAYAHGAAMMINRDVIDKVGLMPEEFFLYYEEVDWCEKIKSNGYKIFYVPQVKIIHKDSQSTGQNSPLKKYYMVRNRLLFTKRNRKGATRVLSISYQIFIAVPKDIVCLLFAGKMDLAKAAIKGVAHFIML